MKTLKHIPQLKYGSTINFRCFDKALNRECKIKGTFVKYDHLDLGGEEIPLMRYLTEDGKQAVINLGALS